MSPEVQFVPGFWLGAGWSRYQRRWWWQFGHVLVLI